MDSTVGEHNTKLCVIQTGMTITHGGFENKSLPFPPLLKLGKKNKKKYKINLKMTLRQQNKLLF